MATGDTFGGQGGPSDASSPVPSWHRNPGWSLARAEEGGKIRGDRSRGLSRFSRRSPRKGDCPPHAAKGDRSMFSACASIGNKASTHRKMDQSPVNGYDSRGVFTSWVPVRTSCRQLLAASQLVAVSLPMAAAPAPAPEADTQTTPRDRSIGNGPANRFFWLASLGHEVPPLLSARRSAVGHDTVRTWGTHVRVGRNRRRKEREP